MAEHRYAKILEFCAGKRFETRLIILDIMIVACNFLPGISKAQLILPGDSLLLQLNSPVFPGDKLVRYRIKNLADYSVSVSGLMLLNRPQESGPNQATLLHHLTWKSTLSNDRNFKLQGTIIHDLGIQYFFDSITRFQPDQSSLGVKMEVRICRWLVLTFVSNLSTRLFNAYKYYENLTGETVSALQSSFLTPLVLTFSTGFGAENPRLYSLHLGITGGKLTYIRNREVYRTLKVKTFQGVESGRRFLLEYGLSMQLVMNKNISPALQWNCEVNLFQGLRKPVDFNLKNILGLKIGRYFKGSLQTRLIYEEEVSKSMQMENNISFGFCFSL